MKYFIGVDGGGTKTAFAVSSLDGIPIQTFVTSGCSYQSMGVGAAVHMIYTEVKKLLTAAGISVNDCAGCCIGMPCFGENTDIDKMISDYLIKQFAPMPVYVVNDVEVGWAGALECQEGIHIVSGTGSIAFGSGAKGQSARCGGWNEFYGDEGSCYWIGRQAMSLFTKESDGRVPKGALYEIVRRELEILNDFYFIDIIQERWAPYRSKVAMFQQYAYQAAKEGDHAAVELYQQAAYELALLVKAVKDKLVFSTEPIHVSYSGGLFQTGEMILRPFAQEIERLGAVLKAPLHNATEGALLLAINKFN